VKVAPACHPPLVPGCRQLRCKRASAIGRSTPSPAISALGVMGVSAPSGLLRCASRSEAALTPPRGARVVAQNRGKGAGKGAKTLCYNCGSAEHNVHDCKAPPSEGGAGFRFASCFVCGEKGHISRECPQNAKGIYVKGGCCKLCQGTCVRW
jgi:hypothetical protein